MKGRKEGKHMPKMPENKFFVCQAKINLVIRVAFLSQARDHLSQAVQF
jgi:hypothetical protein